MSLSETEKIKILDNYYYDNGFNNSRDALYGLVRDKGITRRFVQEYLNKQKSYQINKDIPATQKDDYNRIIPTEPFKHLQMDTINVEPFQIYNDNVKYLLTIIDIFTKKAFVYPLKELTQEAVVNKLKLLLNDIDLKPSIINTDNGNEFKGKTETFLKDNKITLIYSKPHSPQSQGYIERFNGTLKRTIKRNIQKLNNNRYIDDLQKIVNGYNETKTKILKLKPNDVLEPENILKSKQLLENEMKRGIGDRMDSLGVNQKVRLRYDKQELTTEQRNQLQFRKGFVPNWSNDIMTIDKVIVSKNPLKLDIYRLKELKGNFTEKIYKLYLMTPKIRHYQIFKYHELEKNKERKFQRN